MAKSKLYFDKINPMTVPTEWHRYLYRSVLLPWETSLKQNNHFPRFNPKKLIAGVSLQKKESSQEMEEAWRNQDLYELNQNSSLTFHVRNGALQDLFKLLRNCVAHGHYTKASPTKIHFNHKYNNKLQLFGTLKFSQLKELILLIQPSESGKNCKP